MSTFLPIAGGRIGFLLCVVLLVLPAPSSAATTSALTDQPVVTSRSLEVISERTRNSLTIDEHGNTKVWVFFTDKGITTKSAFDRAASAISISPRALGRRRKIGLDKVLFADLPVDHRYIEAIESMGARHRRSSRWLNAASFELPLSLLDKVADLAQVSEFKPLGLFRRDSSITTPNVPEPISPQSTNDLKYGSSFRQLQQIGVPSLHDKGFTGKGVTLAIFDTGFRKSHQAFANHFIDGRVLAEYDFIFDDSNTANEPDDGDAEDQWNHGTYIWSVSGGSMDGTLFGPAFEANFILCKTEDVRSETPVEEDNWVAALEWVDSLGADVVTSSLGYIFWYSYSDLDGSTAVITVVANMADSLGIVICNAIGNFGSSAGSLIAPADAHNILSVGAVNGNGTLANFSSRGPTFDGRIKPEVLAQGVNTFAASALTDDSYTLISGTSLSTPLVAGAVCQLIQAHPQYTPAMIRRSIMETASQADAPDNDFGWGIVDANQAVGWGVETRADTLLGNAPLTVQFGATSVLDPTEWLWEFGDGATATIPDPIHTFAIPGVYNVSLTVSTNFGAVQTLLPEPITVLGDTLSISGDSAFAGHQVILSFTAMNSQPLTSIMVPFELGGSPFSLSFDSATVGARTMSFLHPVISGSDVTNNRYVIQMSSPVDSLALPPGNGEIMKLYATIDRQALGGIQTTISTLPVGSFAASFRSNIMSYNPLTIDGWAGTKQIQRGDADYSRDGYINLTDLTFLISYLFLFTGPPVTVQSGDADANGALNMQDILYLVDYLFLFGPPPPTP